MRLEAGVFDREAGRAAESVEQGKFGAVKFGDIAVSYMFGRSVKLMRTKSPYPFFQPSSVTDIKPKTDGYLYSRKQSEIDELMIHKGQVLLSRSGAIGRAVYVSDTLDGKYLSPDMLRIDTNNPEDTGYVYAYLKSSAGQKILQSLAFGAVILHINPEHLNDIHVPYPPEEIRRKIHELVVKSYALRDESNILLDEAESLLVRELGLPPVDGMKAREGAESFEVSSSELCGRFEASYHSPLFGRIEGILRRNAGEVITVGSERVSRKIILPGIFKRVYVGEGYGVPFLGGKQIGELDPYDKKYLSFLKHDKLIREVLTIRENMILVTCIGTVGKAVLVPKYWDGWAVSQNIMRVVPVSDDIAGYIYVWLASEWGRELVRRYSCGGVVEEVRDEHMRQVPFPLLRDEGAQKRINSLALEANAKRTEAYMLEREALGIMEKEIIQK